MSAVALPCPRCDLFERPSPTCTICRGTGTASWGPPPARARATDPGTSHAAAASVSETGAGKLRARVHFLLQTIGPMHDVKLCDAYHERERILGWPSATDSGIRTRRSELVTAGHVADTGDRVRLETGRHAIVWRAT